METEVSVSKLNTLQETLEETTKGHKSIQNPDKEHVESNWRDVINISAKYEKYKPKIIETLEQHQSRWDGHLGTIHVTGHYIELTPGARPQNQLPYRAGPPQLEQTKNEVEKMLNAVVLEPSKSGNHRKYGSLLFCIDNGSLNAMAILDSYPIPRMGECIDSI